MKRIPGIAAILVLSACCIPGPDGEPATGPDAGPDVLRDGVIGPAAAEPPWRDLIRHTNIPAPGLATDPGPSLDGKHVAYATTEFGDELQIALRTPSGAAPARISQSRALNRYPRISPDGKRIAYASNKEGNWDIYVARMDAPLTIVQVTFEPSDDIAPSWSPKGKKLVYSSRPEPGAPWQMVIADVGTRIKTYLGPGLFADWSPNDEEDLICFQSQPRSSDERSGIWIVTPDGTGLREVVSDKAQGWSAIHPRFSRDGRWIAYATVQRSVESRTFGRPDEADDIWVIRTDGTYDTRLTNDLSPEWWPAWGKGRVYFISVRDGGQNIYSVRVKPLEDAEEEPAK